MVRILRTATGWAPSESTLLRHFHRLELIGPGAGEVTTVFGRFEASDPNEMWCGDALHGPRVGDRKTYLFAFIDDHSRLLVGYRFGFAEDTVRLAAALRPALAACGVPASIYVTGFDTPSRPRIAPAACGNETPPGLLILQVIS
ncbi:integrase core domain protein [Mycobacterium kansasii 732]|nr:integrase core domain protein [Mycobacterium kansasii 732]